MINCEFKNWLMLEAERMPLDQVEDSCKTTCPDATVIWLIKLEENWEQYKNLLPEASAALASIILSKESENVLQSRSLRYYLIS